MALIKYSKEEQRKNPIGENLKNLDLSRMNKGWHVDYSGNTFQVTDYAEYDWGEGFITQEWKLNSGKQTLHLERELDDNVIWLLGEDFENDKLREIYVFLKKNENPPPEITVSGVTYWLADSGAGQFCPEGRRPGRECIMWAYVNNENTRFLAIYQWGDSHFTCKKSDLVKEEMFSNIISTDK